MKVYMLVHIHVFPPEIDEEEDQKIIGIYSSEENARKAAKRIAQKPGFRDSPQILNGFEENFESGFYINQYELDSDKYWQEGFITETYPK